MELWRGIIEFQGKYQLLNVSNPALAFGKLKWIFSGQYFSQQPRLLPCLRPSNTKRWGEIIALPLESDMNVASSLDCKLSVCSQVVVDAERQIHYDIAASSLASSAACSARWPSVNLRAGYLKTPIL